MDPKPSEDQPRQEQKSSQGFSRRKLFKYSAGALALALGVRALREQRKDPQPSVSTDIPFSPTLPPRQPEVSQTPEVLNETPTEYGFNTHMHAKPEKGEHLTLDTFKKSVETLVAHNQKHIRLNFMDWEICPDGDTTKINWDNKALEVYDEAISYAKSHGLDVTMVSFTPSYAKEYPHDDYKEVTRLYYETMATRYKGQVDTWQIFNEADIHQYRDYKYQPNLINDPRYIAELAEIVAVASTVIKAHDPNTRTTTNIAHWAGSQPDFYTKASKFFDAMAPNIDVITLDLYPKSNMEEIMRLSGYVNFCAEKYKKPVVIGELGMESTGPFNEDSQAHFVSLAISALKSGKHQPEIVMIYELTDETTQGGSVENSYGFFKLDGTPKKGFSEIVERMQTKKKKDPATPIP